MSWAPLIRRAAREFAISPEVFWRLSLKEWRALTLVPLPSPILSRADFDTLAAAHPDQPPSKDAR